LNLDIVKIIDKFVGAPICISLTISNKLISIIRKKPKSMDKSKVKKILLIRLFGFGNLLLALPSFKKIKELYPNAAITLLTVSNNKGLLEEVNFIDEIVYFNVKNLSSFTFSFLNKFFYLRKKKFDMILDYDIFARISAIFSYFLGAKYSIGFAIPLQMRGPLYTKKIDYNNDQHISLTFYDIAAALGAKKPKEINLIKIPASKDDRLFVKKFLKKNNISKSEKLVGIHVGSGSNFITRRWPEANFAKVAGHLIKKYKCRILFTGTKSEFPLIKKTIGFMKHKNKTLILGKSSLRQLALIIERCSLFISTDTGPLHISSAMGTPSISFYGPNTPVLYGPLGNKKSIFFYEKVKCSPCISNYNAKTARCNNPICLKRVTAERVINAIDKNFYNTLKS